MKCSGSCQKTIMASTNMTFAASESRIIDETCKSLAAEGKTVINIIHGTPNSLMGRMYKDITFLWEADDEDPKFKATLAREKAQREAEKQRELAEKKAESEILNLRTVIKTLEERIKLAESNYTEKDVMKLQRKNFFKLLMVSVAFAVIGIFAFWLFAFPMETPLLGVVAILLFGLFSVLAISVAKDAFSDKEKERITLDLRLAMRDRDPAMLSVLKRKLHEKEYELSVREGK